MRLAGPPDTIENCRVSSLPADPSNEPLHSSAARAEERTSSTPPDFPAELGRNVSADDVQRFDHRGIGRAAEQPVEALVHRHAVDDVEKPVVHSAGRGAARCPRSTSPRVAIASCRPRLRSRAGARLIDSPPSVTRVVADPAVDSAPWTTTCSAATAESRSSILTGMALVTLIFWTMAWSCGASARTA